MTNAYTDRKPLFTEAEFAAAKREANRGFTGLFTNAEIAERMRWEAHPYMDDPTLEFPALTDADDPSFGTDDAFPDPINFPPLTCQCGSFSISGVTAEELTREWVAMDSRDHHMGRPCRSGLRSL